MTEPDRPRTCSPSGISDKETPRLTESMWLYQRNYPASVFITGSHTDEGTARDISREVQNRLVLAQRRAGMRAAHWLKVYEARPFVHPHMVAPFNSVAAAQKFVASINSSPALLAFGPRAVFAEIIRDAEGWRRVTTYILHEVTPQAWYKTGRCYPRAEGAKELGQGGGDRVTCSRATEDTLLRSGRIEPRQRTYASRAISRPTKSKRARALVAGENQLVLFPQVAKPVHRLHEFTSGMAPETVATEIQFLMRRRGLTQQALADRAGMSRQRIGNFLHGRFGTTAWTIERIREALAA